METVSCPNLSPLVVSSDSKCICLPCTTVQFELVGRVRDGQGHPIMLASIAVKDTQLETYSEQDGLFSFTLTASVASVVLLVQAGGFRTVSMPVQLDPGLHLTHMVNITLHREDIEVLQLPTDQTFFLLFVTQIEGRLHAAVFKEDEEFFDDNNTIHLSASLGALLAAGHFALVVNISNTYPFQTSVLLGSEIPNLQHPLIDIVNNIPLQLRSNEGFAIYVKSLLKLNLYDFSDGTLINLENLISDVRLIQSNPQNKVGMNFHLFATPYRHANEQRLYQRLTFSNTPYAVHVTGTDQREEFDVLHAQWLRRDDDFTPEFFLVGSETQTCFVPVLTVDCQGDSVAVLAAGIVSFDNVVMAISSGHTPLCLSVPCPPDEPAVDVSLTVIALQDTGIPLQGSPPNIPITNHSLYVYYDRTTCLAEGLSPAGENDSVENPPVTLSASNPRSLYPSIASVDGGRDFFTPDPPYCFLRLETTSCLDTTVYVTLFSNSSGDASISSSGSATATTDNNLMSSGMVCEEKSVFCLPFECMSNLTLTVDAITEAAGETPICVPDTTSSPGRSDFITQFDYQENSYNLFPVRSPAEMVGVYYSSHSKLIAYSRCISSDTPSLTYTCS